MKKLRTIVFILLASVATTSVIAAGSDFAGPYVGLRMTAAGAVVDGSAHNGNGDTTNGAIGGIFAATGGEAGYTLPLGDSPGFVSVGASFITGGATFAIDAGAGAGRGSTNDATIEIKDHWSAYIAPGFAISDSAAVYIKGGYAHGATDDFGFRALHDRVHIHDLHATILHLLGIDHEQLTYRYAGRDFRLTDVSGNVVQEILA